MHSTPPSGMAPGLAYPLRARSSRPMEARYGRKIDPVVALCFALRCLVQDSRRMTTLPPIIHVVDDDASFRAALGELLSACGYTVALYESAEQILKTLPGGDPGCILLDVQMGGVSGPRFRYRLAELGVSP